MLYLQGSAYTNGWDIQQVLTQEFHPVVVVTKSVLHSLSLVSLANVLSGDSCSYTNRRDSTIRRR
jgi:hypothetical protein